MNEKERRELKLKETKILMDGIKDVIEILVLAVLIILFLRT